MTYVDFSKKATTNKAYVNGLNLHEIKSEILQDYTGDFELTGSMLISEIDQKSNTGLEVLMISKLILML